MKMDRERLTITLKKSVLAQVDDFIDGTKIRNRSHAIENLITQSLSPKVSQAVILAGGPGVNMRPFSYEVPKGLFPIGGKPLLEHLIELLRDNGVRDLVFCIGHLGDKIKEHFGNGEKFGVKIRYVGEEKEEGTGGSLRKARKLLEEKTFMVLHGDILVDINLADFINFHKDQERVGTMALTSVVDPSIYGEVSLRGATILNFIEKPEKGKQTSQLINCGVYVFEPEIFDYLPEKGFVSLEDIYPKLAKDKQLAGFSFEGKWFDIGTPQAYEKAIKEWKK